MIALLLVVFSAGAGFAVGRYRADAQTAALSALEARHEMAQARLAQSQAREALTLSERSALSAERAESARLLAQAQTQLARESQDAAFFRAIATAGGDSPVTIQRLRIQTLALPRRYRLALVLARPVGREDVVTGTGSLQLEGTGGGRPAKLALAQVSVDKSAKWGFNYRNMQAIEIDVELPQGFVPERLSIELSPARTGAAGLRQAFLWQPSPL